MFTKFRQHRAYDLAKAEPGKSALGRPVLVTGKVAALGGQILKSPVSGKDCVYYKVIIEKKETRTRTKHVTPGMSRKTKVMEGKEIHEEFFVWVHQATEEMKVDFRLISGDNFIDVPLSKVPVVAHAIRDVVGLKDAADSKVRRTEMSFHVGETVSLIGQLASSSDAENAIIGAVSKDTLIYDNADDWSREDKHTWQEAVREPCFLITDFPALHTEHSR